MKNQLRGSSNASKFFKWTFVLLLVITILAFILFLLKLTQTSEFALQYDQRTQEQVGLYVLMLLFLGAMTLGSGVFALALGRQAKAAHSKLIEQLRQDMSQASSDTERMSIESRLRELGA